ncbi:MAG TPA: hypothetical protein DCL54_03380, partial [Alphaproteobacteria bacterium]|nr:hypothetical protein [Alphaproteobacteria bacterium]
MTPEDLTKLRALIAARDAAEHDFETKGAAAHYVAAVEASKALKDWLGSKAVAIVEHIERVERNRDMWKGQCERQAEALGSAPHRKEHLMSDVLRAVEEIVDVLCKHLGPQVLNQDTASDIDIDRHDDFRNEMQEVAADIVAIPTLRAALAPVTDEEVAGIRERHEELERLGELAHHDWASEAHTDRATLLRRDAQREAELAAVKAERDRAQRACEQMGERITLLEAELGRLREALGTLTDCQPVPKVYKYTGTAEVDVENMFDVGHRHKNGKQPRDY